MTSRKKVLGHVPLKFNYVHLSGVCIFSIRYPIMIRVYYLDILFDIVA